MLGIFRLVLALAVAISHADVRLAGLNHGVFAVIGFYLISGYVMAGLLARHYCSLSAAPKFYLDRAVRLLPQYLFYAGVTLAWFLWASKEAMPLSGFLSRHPSSGDLINNLLIVPLNYYMWNGSDNWTLIPPTWSLGAEIQFYLLAPALLLWPKRLLAVGFVSLTCYSLALVGFLHGDWFAYRLLPGVLIFFILGAWLQRLHRHNASHAANALVVGTLIVALLAGASLHLLGCLHNVYNRETLLGLIVALPLLHFLARQPRNIWDEHAGDLSYGVFLNHFLILWVLFPSRPKGIELISFLAACLVCSAATQHFVERPLLKWRQSLRQRRAALLSDSTQADN